MSDARVRLVRMVPEGEVIAHWSRLYQSGKHKGYGRADAKVHKGKSPLWVEVLIPHDLYSADWNYGGVSSASKERAQTYANLPGKLPPGMASFRGTRGSVKAFASDGNHRAYASFLRGEPSARFYMPLPDYARFLRAANVRSNPDALTPTSREDVAYYERAVPSSRGEIDSAVARAMEAGAEAPLDLQGLGMTAWVFCDARGVAYKVARRLQRSTVEMLATEAEWLRVASTVPGVRMHVAKFYDWRPDLGVIVRECVRAKRSDLQGRRKTEGDLWDLHRTIERAMLPYGFAAPELKADSYVLTRDRGPVLVDAGFALKTGSRLARSIAQRHRDASLHRDELALERGYLRAEYGRTIPQAAGERLERKLAAMRPNPKRRRSVKR